MFPKIWGILDAKIAIYANGKIKIVRNKSNKRPIFIPIWFFWSGIISCCNLGGISKRPFENAAIKEGINTNAMRTIINQLASFLNNKNTNIGIPIAKLKTENFFLKSKPVAITLPSLILSCQTFPPWAVTPTEIPLLAKIIIVPSMVFARVYRAYSSVGKILITSIPETNPMACINSWAKLVIPANLNQ